MSTRHLGVRIDRPADEVYAFAADPTNLPSWASGLAATVEHENGRWSADSPMGRVGFVFAPHNDFGVLDHDVTLPNGDVVHNPMRVLTDGAACDVVFTIRCGPGTSEAAFDADAAAVTRDLETLKSVLESR